MLTVRDSRRGTSRSRSPSGRERSRSRDARPKKHDSDSDDYARRKKSSKKYEDSDSDHATRKKSSSKKYYDESDSDDGRRKKSSSKRHDDSSDSDRRGHRKKRYESESEDDHKSHKKSSKRYSDSEEEDSRSRRQKKPSHRRDRSESSSGSGEKYRHRSHKHEAPPGGFDPRYGQAPYAYAQPGQYMQPPTSGPDYHSTRHMSYVDPKNQHVPWPENGQHGYTQGQYPPGGYAPTIHQHGQQNYAPPGSFPSGDDRRVHTDVPDHHRTHSISSGPGSYAQVPQYQYATVDQNIKYKSKNPKEYTVSPEPVYKQKYRSSHDPQFVEIKPARSDRHDKHDKRSKYGSPPSDHQLATHMGHLAVGGAAAAGTLAVVNQSHGHDHHGKPPASPLLEAYHGTYQSISPMPSPLMIGGKDDSDLSDLELEHSDSDDGRRHSGKLVKISSREHDTHRPSKDRPKAPHRESSASITVVSPTTARKRVSFYDPIPDAKALAKALEHHGKPETRPLVKILPHLTTDDIMALRAEYKNHAKIAGKGINLSKHIKAKVPGHLGKAAYATASGRWESEAYWANVWYQGSAARRELLIESLMGRSNQEVWEIKNSFSDKRYNDDLEKCMKAELKADKFRTAILLALEERRMNESQPLEVERIKRDVEDLHRALISREGGETAMINIIVVRSDNHLREVMRMYEGRYGENFARAMIAKSRNLVGETLAHILNGALNRPMRDALLVHQAIAETAPGRDRAELLISRLVRLHWEPKHMERVKREYERRYGKSVEGEIDKKVIGDKKGGEGAEWGEFCIELVKSSED
ncbi:MAG: hypothetical protein Q9227_001641 [Pyrenula ochraceoflavens]